MSKAPMTPFNPSGFGFPTQPIQRMNDGVPSTFLMILPVLITLPVLLYLRSAKSKDKYLPPGPPSPFFGSKIPQPFSWRHFEEWTKKYGDVFTLWSGFTPMIIVGGYEAAMTLLDGPGARDTADRPLSVAGHTVSGGKRTLLVPYGDRWRRLRKMLHAGLHPKAAEAYEPVQEAAARVFIQDIFASPDGPFPPLVTTVQDVEKLTCHRFATAEFQNHASKYAASVIMTVTYGKTTPTSYTDPEVQQVAKCLTRLGMAARPGIYLVDSFPALRWVPGPWKWRTDGQKFHKEELAMFKREVDKVREKVKDGSAQECFVTELLRRQKEMELSDDEAAYLAGSLFGAGSDTTASAITIAIMAAVCYPATAAAAAAELDRVVGRSRPPTFSDKEDLPYVQAFVKEVFRWRPVSSGGFAHSTTTAITYRTFLIPEGSIIIGNHWSISRDPAVFPEPEEFKPERWFVGEGKKKGEQELRKDIDHVGYGFGRRVCAGKNLADRSLFINVALLLWSFNFSNKVVNGKKVEIDTLGFTSTANSHPLPFKAALTARFDGVRKVLDELSLE